jgi:hypothetical protein
MTTKLFKSVGVGVRNGHTKVRWANDMVSRIKLFSKKGEEVNFIELPQPMSKLAALEYFQANAKMEGDQAYVVSQKIAEMTRDAKKGEVKVKATKAVTKAVKVTKSAVTA